MKEIGLTELPVSLSYIRKSIRKESKEILKTSISCFKTITLANEIMKNQQSYKRFRGREDESI